MPRTTRRRRAQQELIANYRKTVFTAFQDVETALDTVKSTTDQLALVEVQTKADAEAFRISELQYREGTIDILSAAEQPADAVQRPADAGADQAGAAGSLSRALQRAGRRLGAEGATMRATRTSSIGGRCNATCHGLASPCHRSLRQLRNVAGR